MTLPIQHMALLRCLLVACLFCTGCQLRREGRAPAVSDSRNTAADSARSAFIRMQKDLALAYESPSDTALTDSSAGAHYQALTRTGTVCTLLNQGRDPEFTYKMNDELYRSGQYDLMKSAGPDGRELIYRLACPGNFRPLALKAAEMRWDTLACRKVFDHLNRPLRYYEIRLAVINGPAGEFSIKSVRRPLWFKYLGGQLQTILALTEKSIICYRLYDGYFSEAPLMQAPRVRYVTFNQLSKCQFHTASETIDYVMQMMPDSGDGD